jgi:hypothetical protein
MRGAEDLGHRVGLLAVETHHGPARVGVTALVDDQFEVAAALRDDADEVTFVVGELIPEPHPWQEYLGDVHALIITGPRGPAGHAVRRVSPPHPCG